MIRAIVQNLLVVAMCLRERYRRKHRDGKPLSNDEARKLAQIETGLLADYREGK